MYLLRKNSPREYGYSNFEHILGQSKFFACSSFTSKQGHPTKNHQIKQFQWILFIWYTLIFNQTKDFRGYGRSCIVHVLRIFSIYAIYNL